MVEQIILQAQPVITTVVIAIIGLLATYALVAIKKLQGKAAAWLESRTTSTQRDTLHKIAQEAFAHAETAWKGYNGDEKLEGALAYAVQQLKAAGIGVNADEIKAAIHDAWLKFNQAEKAAGTK